MLIMFRYSRSKVLFYCYGLSLSIRVPKQLAESAHSPPTQPFRTSSLKIYSVMLISEIILWLKRNYLQRAGWLGRWQTPGLSWVEGHFLRDTGVPNVTSGKDSSLSSAPNIRISTDAAMFKTVNSLLWNIWVRVFLLNN